MKAGKEGGEMLVKNRYRIVRMIAEGGMSIVYDVYDEVLKKHWALKQLKGSILQTKEQLYTEIELQKNLNHPSLVRIVDMIEENDTCYLVMDLIEGWSLETILKYERCFDEATTVKYALELCDVLAYLHAQGIVFRDLKPSNIMKTKTGKLMLIDFGIARIYKEHHCCDTNILGTKGYAAPEQYANRIYQKAVQSDARSDIYALGATLYHFLTGEKPLLIGDLNLLEYDSSFCEGLHKIIYQCTRIYQKDRYQNIEEVQYHLKHYQDFDKQFVKRLKKHFLQCTLCFAMSILMFFVSFKVYQSDCLMQEQSFQEAFMKIEAKGSYSMLQHQYEETIMQQYQNLMKQYPDKFYLYQSFMQYCEYFEIADQGLNILTSFVNSHPKARTNEILCYLGELCFNVDYEMAYHFFHQANNELGKHYANLCHLFIEPSNDVYKVITAFMEYNEKQTLNEKTLRSTLVLSYAILQQSKVLESEGYSSYELVNQQLQYAKQILHTFDDQEVIERYQKLIQLQQCEIELVNAYRYPNPKHYQQAKQVLKESLNYCISEKETNEYSIKLANLHMFYEKQVEAITIYQQLEQKGDALGMIYYGLHALSIGDYQLALRLYHKIEKNHHAQSLSQFQLFKEKLIYGKLLNGDHHD